MAIFDYEKMAKELAEKALDTEYDGKSVREWVKQIKNYTDVRSEVALQVIGDVEKMARDYIEGILLLDPQNTYCFGGINAFENVIRFLAELRKKYTEEKE